MKSKYTHAIILDFEATCDLRAQPRPQEIIEFPSVLVALDSLDAVDEFRSFVRPHHHPELTEFCKRLTAVEQSEIDNASGFQQVFLSHQAWLKGCGVNEDNALFVTCGEWDLANMLPAQCVAAVPPVEMLPPLYTRWQNLKHLFCSVLGRTRATGMAGMLRELGLPLLGHHHCGIDDCRNIAAVYKALLERGGTSEVTAQLPIHRFPPIAIQLCLGGRRKSVRLTSRDLKALRGLAGRAFQRSCFSFQREDGTQISGRDDLRTLFSGEEIRVIS